MTRKRASRTRSNAWAKENDVTVKFTQTSDFNQLINTRVQGNDAPDVALFPQPGIISDMAEQGLLADLSDMVDKPSSTASPGLLETGQVDGKQYAVPMSINVKSIVFYPKKAGRRGRATSPHRPRRAMALSQKIASTGTTPGASASSPGRRRDGRPPTGSRT